MATQLATIDGDQVPARFAKLKQQVTARLDDYKASLPAHIKPEKFQKVVLTAVQGNPTLLECDRSSLITSVQKCANDGLLPDGREAALIEFRTRQKNRETDKWESVRLVQYLPMAFGVRKKILQSRDVTDIQTAVVYRREVEEGYFIYEEGTERILRHKPMLDLSDDDSADENIVAAYSVATFKDGSKSFEVMRRGEINKVRQASQTGAIGRTDRNGNAIQPKGPWVDWFSEMARKSVMRRHSKTLPMSTDIDVDALRDIEAEEEALYAASTVAVLGSATPEAPKTLPSRNASDHDPETGEVIDDDAQAEADRQALREMDRDTGHGAPDDEITDQPSDPQLPAEPAAGALPQSAEPEAADHQEGRDGADMGEAHNGDDDYQNKAGRLTTAIEGVDTIIDVSSLVAQSASWPPSWREIVLEAGEKRKAQLKAAAPAGAK